ncbi:formate dehydrogenase subunit delta [uncultured Pseudoteredinibacter sp.]|uniref:formate dehydrogenase subunit delta n=1 Tax=uncultured Pseudoteredinibacter sp. TaxID=1641701 RepID=UPI0026068A07|nr:formate dehydrogenase subunit delta [uncultured Pseudoteredinibacter sp.]
MNNEKLISMAKQISANQASTDPQDAAIQLAEHINKFWALSMRKDFVESIEQASIIDGVDQIALADKIRI